MTQIATRVITRRLGETVVIELPTAARIEVIVLTAKDAQVKLGDKCLEPCYGGVVEAAG